MWPQLYKTYYNDFCALEADVDEMINGSLPELWSTLKKAPRDHILVTVERESQLSAFTQTKSHKTEVFVSYKLLLRVQESIA